MLLQWESTDMYGNLFYKKKMKKEKYYAIHKTKKAAPSLPQSLSERNSTQSFQIGTSEHHSQL